MDIFDIDNIYEYYLTSSLIIKNGISYYYKNNKYYHITNKNWHNYYNEYGWNKLNKGWIMKLNKYRDTKENSRWGILDCGSKGDCLFSCIAEAIMEPDPQEIRKLAASRITKKNFSLILYIYKAGYKCNDFENHWNPNKIVTYKDLRNELTIPGDNYWGDHIILSLLKEALDVNFIILNDNSNCNEKYTLYKTTFNFDQRKKTIILYYYDEYHFQLIGYFDKYMKTLFDKLPIDMVKLYNKNNIVNIY